MITLRYKYRGVAQRINPKSCPMQDGAEMGNDSSVKGAEMAPPRRIAVPCWLYDHQHAGRSRRKYCRTQRVREALPERDLCPNESRRSIRVDRSNPGTLPLRIGIEEDRKSTRLNSSHRS